MTALAYQKHGIAGVSVTLLATIEVLDMTITSVALNDMAGSLSAGPEQITWTMTVYMIAAAVFMPLTGLLTDFFGRKNLIMISALSFALASLCCGLSSHLIEIVIFRGLQGMFGALLPGLAQSTLWATFTEPRARAKAMAGFGMGIMMAPVLGPVLGGYITEHWGWPWIFFINLPVCCAAGALAWYSVIDTPRKSVHIDGLGLLAMVIGIGAFQYVLDRGSQNNWFESRSIVGFSLVSLMSLAIFIARGWSDKDYFIHFHIFRDKNFTLSCITMVIYFAAMLGAFVWQPLWMEMLMGYPTLTTGILMIPRGVSCFLIIGFVPQLLRKVDPRWLVVLAALLFSVGAWMTAGFNLQQDPWHVLESGVIQGVANGFLFVPLTMLAYYSVSPSAEVTGLFNFFRSIGGSIGVALFGSMVSHYHQTSWHRLGGYIHAMNPRLLLWAQQHHLDLTHPKAHALLGQLLDRQSMMIAFNQANALLLWLPVFIILCVIYLDGKPNMDVSLH